MTGRKTIFIISDSTGETATHVLQTALVQFPANRMLVDVRRFPEINTPEKLAPILFDAAISRALIIHTLVLPEVREALAQECADRELVVIDVLGPIIEQLEDYFGDELPLHEEGLTQRFDEMYLRRVRAMEFVVQHDDGKHVEGLREAEVVLVGVSRTAKTPLSLYLASRGVLVGNVPLVPGIEPPDILFELDLSRVFGLIVSPSRLLQIRQERVARLGVAGGDYDAEEKIREEIKGARLLFARTGWPVIDMTARSIESAAEEIVRRIGRL